MQKIIAQHQAYGMLWSLLGTLAVLISVLLMNASKHINDNDNKSNSVQFEVAKIERPKPVKKIEQKKPKPAKVSPPIPLVNLDSSLAGIEFDLPAFAMDSSGIDKSLIGDTSNVVMTGDTVDVVPRPIQRAPLEYPPRAKNKELEGYVVLSLLISKTGKVEKAKVIEASPPGVFDNAALRSIMRWVFEPAYFNGKPVTSWANQTIRFEMG